MNHHLSYLVICAAELCAAVTLHEAGHAVVARSYGIGAQTRLFMESGALSGYTEYDDGLTDHQFRIVALAGRAATTSWQRPDVTAEQLIEEKWTPTPRDAKDAGDFGAADLAECLQILRSHWGEVEAEARLLLQALLWIRESAPPPDDAPQ
jgi:hypothetical protein